MPVRALKFETVPLKVVRMHAVKQLAKKEHAAGFSSWRDLHALMHGENDPETLHTLVSGIESAIFARTQELTDDPADVEERKQMARACQDLYRIKTVKLGWPKLEAASAAD